jgi:hypothetical protein
MGKLQKNSSVRPQDLEQLDRLLDSNEESNAEWNKLEILQQRISKKISFMSEFMKDKNELVNEKRIQLEKASMTLKEMRESVQAVTRELKGRRDVTARGRGREVYS